MSVSGILENGFLDRIETHFSFFLVVIKIDVLLEQTGCLRARQSRYSYLHQALPCCHWFCAKYLMSPTGNIQKDKMQIVTCIGASTVSRLIPPQLPLNLLPLHSLLKVMSAKETDLLQINFRVSCRNLRTLLSHTNDLKIHSRLQQTYGPQANEDRN